MDEQASGKNKNALTNRGEELAEWSDLLDRTKLGDQQAEKELAGLVADCIFKEIEIPRSVMAYLARGLLRVSQGEGWGSAFSPKRRPTPIETEQKRRNAGAGVYLQVVKNIQSGLLTSEGEEGQPGPAFDGIMQLSGDGAEIETLSRSRARTIYYDMKKILRGPFYEHLLNSTRTEEPTGKS